MTWLPLISRHLAGQSVVMLINIIIGLTLLRILTIEEFALYTLATVFLQLAASCSDVGLGQAIMTLGARIREQQQSIGSMYSSACWYGNRLYAVATTAVVCMFLLTTFDRDWPPLNAGVSLFLLLVVVKVQQQAYFRKSVLNINHDATGLFYVGISEAGTRLLLLPLCMMWPYTAVALLASLTGTYTSRIVAVHQCRYRMTERQPSDESQKEGLERFIKPLIPVAIYNSIQGQMSVFILGWYGYTASIAHVGALGRLGQFVAIPMMLNGFWVQPLFSRITDRGEFVRRAALVIGSIIVFAIASMVSVFVVPQWWLVIVGHNYGKLVRELPIAILTALVSLLGATIYTMVISRSITQGQSWYIATGVLGQILFLWIWGIHSTIDALLLSFVPILGYCLVQAFLLGVVISGWKEETRVSNTASYRRGYIFN